MGNLHELWKIIGILEIGIKILLYISIFYFLSCLDGNEFLYVELEIVYLCNGLETTYAASPLLALALK